MTVVKKATIAAKISGLMSAQLLTYPTRRIDIVLVAGLLVFSNILCASLNAQVSGGSLSGTVTDSSQAAIPNVQVTLINIATRAARTVVTDDTGLYIAPDLLPGSYEMTAAAPGFTTQVPEGFVSGASRSQRPPAEAAPLRVSCPKIRSKNSG